MRTLLITMFIAFASLLTGADAAGKALPAGIDGTWLTDYTAARQLANTAKVPLLIDFTGSDWCHWCKKLDSEVFSKPEFVAWAKQRVVLLKVDFPRNPPLPDAVAAVNQKLATQFNVQGYPSVLVVHPGTEKVLKEYGYNEGGPQKWVEGLVEGTTGLGTLAWKAAK